MILAADLCYEFGQSAWDRGYDKLFVTINNYADYNWDWLLQDVSPLPAEILWMSDISLSRWINTHSGPQATHMQPAAATPRPGQFRFSVYNNQ